MPFYTDLSEYVYSGPGADPSKNVGWLDERHAFPTEDPCAELLDAIWDHCSILVCPTRGLHACTLCESPSQTFARRDKRLLLGSGEIRVFGACGEAYAAPNMIYHYILAHHYRPPTEFLRAIKIGPRPGSDDYAASLRAIKVAWRENVAVLAEPRAFRAVRTADGVQLEEMTGRVKK